MRGGRAARDQFGAEDVLVAGTGGLAVGIQSFVTQFETNWGFMAAAAVLITIPAAVVFMFAQRHLVAGLTAGGAKG